MTLLRLEKRDKFLQGWRCRWYYFVLGLFFSDLQEKRGNNIWKSGKVNFTNILNILPIFNYLVPEFFPSILEI